MRSLRRGQIYRLKSDNVGKQRPVLIISPAKLNGGIYVSAAPFYSGQLDKRRHLASCVFFTAGEFGLDADCVLKTDEVTQFKISELQISEGAVGEVDPARMAQVDKSLCFSLGIEMHSETWQK